MESLFILLQLTNSSVPLGAYNYSDGLEFLIESNVIVDAEGVKHWLTTELQRGSIRMDVAVMLSVAEAIAQGELSTLGYWNTWLHGTRETLELRQQSLQMGDSLLKLLGELDGEKQQHISTYKTFLGKNCHYAVAFGVAIALWEMDRQQAVWAYLHSWASNLIGTAVKLVPLGQTQGQQIIYQLHPVISTATTDLLKGDGDRFYACTWGLSLASMNHETQYTRLFRS